MRSIVKTEKRNRAVFSKKDTYTDVITKDHLSIGKH